VGKTVLVIDVRLLCRGLSWMT